MKLELSILFLCVITIVWITATPVPVNDDTRIFPESGLLENEDNRSRSSGKSSKRGIISITSGGKRLMKRPERRKHHCKTDSDCPKDMHCVSRRKALRGNNRKGKDSMANNHKRPHANKEGRKRCRRKLDASSRLTKTNKRI